MKMNDFLNIPESALLVARQMKIIPEIHPDDFIYRFVQQRWAGDVGRSITNYYELGQHSAKLVKQHTEAVDRLYKRQFGADWIPKSITDLASGYGGVARHLGNYFPDSDVHACDIHDKAVLFNKDVLKVDAIQSSSIPEELNIPRSDLIIALSFFSHMPIQTYRRWLMALASKLSKNGAMIFTANGYLGENVILKSSGIHVGEDGFGFRPTSEQKDLNSAEYGLTISHPRFVLPILNELGLRVVRYEEGVWWGTQDAYLCMRM
jgi:hypothetical protein